MRDMEKLINDIEKLNSAGKTDVDSLEGVFKSHSLPRRNMGTSSKDQNKKSILPIKGFSVKTADSNGKKFFLNICRHAEIPLPPNLDTKPPNLRQDSEKLDTVDESPEQDSGANSDLPRIPLSLGPLRNDSDHSGVGCSTLDVVYNSNLLELAEKKRELKVHMIRTAVRLAQDLLEITLDPQWKLPKLRYKGEITPQVLNLLNLPVVQEVQQQSSKRKEPSMNHQDAASRENPVGGGKSQKAAKLDGKELQSKIITRGDPVDSMELEIQGDGKISQDSVEIEISGYEVSVRAKSYQPCKIQLPFFADASNSSAEFDAKGNIALKLPYLPLKNLIEA